GKPLTGHTGPVTTVQVGQSDGRTLVISGGEDGTIRLWNPEAGHEIVSPAVLPWPVDAVTWTGPDRIAAACGSEVVALAIR
ncbi:WD40 repeat domain-containing protein, partial [Streptomyces griseorubiginosus]